LKDLATFDAGGDAPIIGHCDALADLTHPLTACSASVYRKP
jgi:hypothetical protein